MASSDPRPDSAPILSASSILIVSGFLIGLTVGKVVGAEISPYVLTCGLSGFLAFIAFDVSSTRRKEDAIQRDQEMMEEKLDKHVLSLSSISFELPPPEKDEEFLFEELQTGTMSNV